MKKAAIVCDNYKVDKFNEELRKAGFNNFEVSTNGGKLKGTTTISVSTTADKYKKIAGLCQMVEMHFKQSN